MIQVGDKLPETTFTVNGPDGPETVNTSDVFGGRKVALFAVPGAFTPTCSNNHLPGFVEHAGDFKAKGVDAVVCVAVNDVFVLAAWSKAAGADGKVEFLADGSAEFAKATGLDLDMNARGLGIRSKRYAAIVDNGVVHELLVEDVPSKAESSSAESLLAKL